MRLLEATQWGTAYLQTRGIESPRLEVELILAHVLQRPRLALFLEANRELQSQEENEVLRAVRRRGQREPLQHVLGCASFCGLDLEVSGDALIPRPETELLAEEAWKWLRTRREHGTATPSVLDWGTGSGCLAVAIAWMVPRARVTALEIEPGAAALARRNVTRHGLDHRITLVEGDGCVVLAPGNRFDLIVSNPPYIPSAEVEALQPEVRDHDPRIALDGGPDGLSVYRRLAGEFIERTTSEGRLFLEFGDGQASELAELLAREGWIVEQVFRDYSQRERFLRARREP